MDIFSLKFDKKSLPPDIEDNLFWKLLSDRICCQISDQNNPIILVGDSSASHSRVDINIYECNRIEVIIDDIDIISKQKKVMDNHSIVNLSTQFLVISDFVLRGKLNKDPQSYEKSIIHKLFETMFDIPWIDETCLRIHEKLKITQKERNIPYLKVNYWKPGKQFGVALSHDVDHLKLRRSHFLSISKLWFSKKKLLPFSFYLKSILHFFNLKNYSNNFQSYCSIEKSFNVPSTYFFLVSKAIKMKPKEINLLLESNVEIALHGDLGTSDNEEKLIHEKSQLEKIFGIHINGIRQHYLEFKPKITWSIQKNIKLMYDSTLGFNKMAGFRAGTSHPYFPTSNFVEIPLILMDSIWYHSNENQTKTDWKKEIFSYIDKVKQYNGLFTLNWHQSSLHVPFNYLYKDIIKYLNLKGGEFLQYDQIANRCLLRRRFINSIKIDTENKTIFIPKDKKYSFFSLKYNKNEYEIQLF